MDQQFYAIKKTVLWLNSSHPDSIREELDRMMKEVRLLASVQDPHVISYNHSWFESTLPDRRSPTGESEPALISPYITFASSAEDPGCEAESPDSSTAGTTGEEAASIEKIALYIQMELCERTLDDYLAGQTEIGEKQHRERLHIAYGIMQGLAAVHIKYGLIHRDLTPRNIFFGKDGTVKIGDFGLATRSQHLVRAAPSPYICAAASPVLDLPPPLSLNEEETAVEDFGSSKDTSRIVHENEKAIIGTKTYAAPEQVEDGIFDQSVSSRFEE